MMPITIDTPPINPMPMRASRQTGGARGRACIDGGAAACLRRTPRCGTSGSPLRPIPWTIDAAPRRTPRRRRRTTGPRLPSPARWPLVMTDHAGDRPEPVADATMVHVPPGIATTGGAPPWASRRAQRTEPAPEGWGIVQARSGRRHGQVDGRHPEVRPPGNAALVSTRTACGRRLLGTTAAEPPGWPRLPPALAAPARRPGVARSAPAGPWAPTRSQRPGPPLERVPRPRPSSSSGAGTRRRRGRRHGPRT